MTVVDQGLIRLYDAFTHGRMGRAEFEARLSALAGPDADLKEIERALSADRTRAGLSDPNDMRLIAGRTARASDAPVEGYLARPATGGGHPGVLVVHENRGLNPHVEDITRRVALEGFTAFAPDFLAPFGGTPEDEDEAREMIARLDMAEVVARGAAALDWLSTDGTGKAGAMGFCWGGGVVNRLAVSAPGLDAGVVYYGRAPDPEEVPRIRAKLLLHYAGLDERINAGVPGYVAALDAAGVDYTRHNYPGVNHASNNDTSAARYDEAAAKLAWQRSIAFLREALG